MSAPRYPTVSFAIALPERYAARLADVPDLSQYVWRLVAQRELQVDSAIRTLRRAGWQPDEILAAAIAWSRYVGGPPTELVAEAERPTRAVLWGAEREDVVARFALDPNAWRAKVEALKTNPALGDAIGCIGNDLGDGVGAVTLRRRIAGA